MASHDVGAKPSAYFATALSPGQEVPGVHGFVDALDELNELSLQAEEALRYAESSLEQFSTLMSGTQIAGTSEEGYNETFEALEVLTRLQAQRHASKVDGGKGPCDLQLYDELINSLNALIERIGRAEAAEGHFTETPPIIL